MDKRTDMIKNTQCKVEDVFDDIISKYSISQGETNKKIPFSQTDMKNNISLNIKFFETGKKK